MKLQNIFAKKDNFTNEELKAFSVSQLQYEIVHKLVQGDIFLPLVQAVQIMYEKGGWTEKTWNKEINKRREDGEVVSFFDAAVQTHKGFGATRQLCLEFLIIAGASVTDNHIVCCGRCGDGSEQFSQKPYQYIFKKQSLPTLKRAGIFVNTCPVDFEHFHSLQSINAKMLYIHELFVSKCCKTWSEAEFQAILLEVGEEGFTPKTESTDSEIISALSSLKRKGVEATEWREEEEEEGEGEGEGEEEEEETKAKTRHRNGKRR